MALPITQALDDDLDRHGYDIAINGLRHDVFVLACQSPHASATPIAIQLGARSSTQNRNYPKPEYLRLRNAMEIAGTRPAHEISRVIDRDERLRHEDPDFGLLLTQELVLHGSKLSPGAARYAEWAERTGHPLAALPLGLLEIEREMPTGLPHYPGALGTWSWPIATATSDEYVPLRELLRGIGASVPLAAGDAVLKPFEDWIDHSNGRVHVAVYRPGNSFAGDLPEPRIHADLPATLIEPAQALRSLFIAALGGGAYSPSPGGATARLRVWTSLAALVDLPLTSPVDQVAKRAGDARWLRLETADEWFDDLAWDVWMVVDDGRRVVSIAATDTD